MNQSSPNKTISFDFQSNLSIQIDSAFNMVEAFVCIFVFLFSAFSLMVFWWSQDMQANTYLYLKAKTLAEMVITGLVVVYPLSYCMLCSVSTSLVVQLFSWTAFSVLSNIAYFFIGFMELAIIFDRYKMIKSKSTYSKKTCTKYILICLAFSTLATTPVFASLQIAQTDSGQYKLNSNDFGTSAFGFYYQLIYSFAVNIVFIFLFLLLGVMLIIEYGIFIRKKRNLVNPISAIQRAARLQTVRTTSIDTTHRSEKNLTSMVLILGVFFLLSRLVYFLGTSYKNYFNVDTLFSRLFRHVSFLIIYITIGLNLFLYLKFNRTFRDHTSCILKKLHFQIIRST
jgi:hypothetical protein